MDTHVRVLAILNLVFAGPSPSSVSAAPPPLLCLMWAVPGLAVGIGLLKRRPWARILGIVVSALGLMHIPFGTALGIYGLWVLFSRDTERLFAPPTP